MNDLIYEAVVTSVSPDGRPHVAPMGARYSDEGNSVVLMPFKPSTTLDNILATGCAVLNVVADVRVFAGCVTGRRDWPTVATSHVPCVRLACAMNHAELRLTSVQQHEQRPVLSFERVALSRHADFLGFNRAQAAVVEGAILVSRLFMLPPDKVQREMEYLQIAIDKTAGPAEHEAWNWLLDAVQAHRNSPS